MARAKQSARKVAMPRPKPLTRHQRALLAAFQQTTRCAPVRPATMLCGRVHWLEGVGTDCRYCGGCGTLECNRCGYEPSCCATCGQSEDLVRDPHSGVVLCERDVLRSTAVQTLAVCKEYGVHVEALKRAILQAVFGAVPLAHMSCKDGDDMRSDGDSNDYDD